MNFQEAEDFSYYVETTVDPGSALGATVVVICILIFFCLPKCISYGERRRRENIRIKHKDGQIVDTDEDHSDASYQDSDGNNLPVEVDKEEVEEEEYEDTRSKDNKSSYPGEHTKLTNSHTKYEHTTNCMENITNDSISTEKILADLENLKISTKHDKMSSRKEPAPLIESQLSRVSSTLSNSSSNAPSIAKGILSARPALRVGRLLSQSSGIKMNTSERDEMNPSSHNKKEKRGNENSNSNHSLNVGSSSSDPIDASESSDDDKSQLGAYFDLSELATAFNRLVEVANWDDEMKTLWKLSRPFATQAFVEGFFDLLSVGIIGHVFGAREANAYVVVMILNKLTNFVNYGFYEALGSLIPKASDAGNESLIGEYFQVGILMFSISAIPVILLWSLATEEAFIWLGFDEETARLGQGFACSYVFAEVIRGVDECLHVVLSFKGKETYSTIVHTISCFSKPFAVFIMVEKKDLIATGALQLAFAVCLTVGNFVVVGLKGWLGSCWGGFVGRWAIFDGAVVEEMIRTAIPLGVSWVLTFGEWELMVLFARYMGPAEVAAWSLLNILWVTFELITEGFTIATELRVSEHMNNGSLKLAQSSAHKAMLLAIVVSLIITSLVYILGEILVTWLSPDPTLQRMMYDVLPLLGFGQTVLAFCATCWSVLGSQGRHQIATVTKLLTTWVLVIPFAVILVYVANFNLLSLVAALVMGCTLRGVSSAYLIFTSNWDNLAVDMSGEATMLVKQEIIQDEHDAVEKGIVQKMSKSFTEKSASITKSERISKDCDTNTKPVRILDNCHDAESTDIESKLSEPSRDANLNEVEECSAGCSKEQEDTVGADTGGAPPLVLQLDGNGDEVVDTSGRPGMMIDTETVTATVSSCSTSLGGVEDRWIVESVSGSSDASDSTQSSSSASPSQNDDDRPFGLGPIMDAAAAAATSWGLFK